MSRIADPIDAGLTMIVGNRPRGRQPSREESEDATDQGKAPPAPLLPAPATKEPEPLVLSDPAGTAFVVALAAGELPPVPPNPQEVKLRGGGVWSPPDTGQRLTDRKV